MLDDAPEYEQRDEMRNEVASPIRDMNYFDGIKAIRSGLKQD